MLFSCGIAVGVYTLGVAEPMAYYRKGVQAQWSWRCPERRRARAAGSPPDLLPLGSPRVGSLHHRRPRPRHCVLQVEHAPHHEVRVLPAPRQPHLLPRR
jgi:hypothetical protein